jgi:desulfoferrodoxin (superoxide reductase-like protein)
MVIRNRRQTNKANNQSNGWFRWKTITSIPSVEMIQCQCKKKKAIEMGQRHLTDANKIKITTTNNKKNLPFIIPNRIKKFTWIKVHIRISTVTLSVDEERMIEWVRMIDWIEITNESYRFVVDDRTAKSRKSINFWSKSSSRNPEKSYTIIQ